MTLLITYIQSTSFYEKENKQYDKSLYVNEELLWSIMLHSSYRIPGLPSSFNHIEVASGQDAGRIEELKKKVQQTKEAQDF